MSVGQPAIYPLGRFWKPRLEPRLRRSNQFHQGVSAAKDVKRALLGPSPFVQQHSPSITSRSSCVPFACQLNARLKSFIYKAWVHCVRHTFSIYGGALAPETRSRSQLLQTSTHLFRPSHLNACSALDPRRERRESLRVANLHLVEADQLRGVLFSPSLRCPKRSLHLHSNLDSASSTSEAGAPPEVYAE